jgi:hypothetical protein
LAQMVTINMPQLANRIDHVDAYDLPPAPARRSYDAGGIRSVLARTAKSIPTFFAVSFILCTLAYYVFHVPLDEVGTVAGIPCFVGFAMTRILSLILPRSAAEDELSRIPISFHISALLSVVAAFVAIDFVISAIIFYRLKLNYAAIGSLTIAEFSSLGASVFIVLALITRFSWLWTTAMLAAAIKLLRAQTRLTAKVLTPPWHKHWSR